VDQVEGAPLEQFGRPVPQDSLHRRAGVAEHTVVTDDRDDVRRVLDQRAEVLLAVAQRLFGGGTVDRGGEDVRHGLQEVRVVDRELPAASAVGSQDAERPVLPVNQHAQAAHHPVRREQRRGGEAGIRRQLFHDHRSGGAQRVAGVGVGIGGDDDRAAISPTHARPQHQGPALRTKLQHTAELDLEHPGGEPDGGVHQVPNRRTGEGLLPQVRHGLLLSRGRLQRGLGARQPGVARLAVRAQQSEPRSVHCGVTTLHSAVVFSTVDSTAWQCATSRRAP